MSINKASHFLSRILRHNPGAVGIQLDSGGWADVDDLLAAMNRTGFAIDRAFLERVVAENDKRRFSFSPDGTKIRANQGHSIPVDLGLTPQEPPEFLYHGTAAVYLDAIRRDGLKKGRRHAVHLSLDAETARRVGKRHGKPVVLVIQARRMHADGHTFTCSDNGVWLVDAVPAEYMEIPESQRAKHHITDQNTLLQYLDQHGIAYVRSDHPPVYTCEEAAMYRPPAPGLDTKNLFLRDERNRYLLVMTACEKRLNLKALGEALGVKKLHFASLDQLMERLGLTPGAVTVLALVNDPGGQVELLVDAEYYPAETYLCHPLVNTATLALSHAALARFFEITGHAPRVVEIPAG